MNSQPDYAELAVWITVNAPDAIAAGLSRSEVEQATELIRAMPPTEPPAWVREAREWKRVKIWP